MTGLEKILLEEVFKGLQIRGQSEVLAGFNRGFPLVPIVDDLQLKNANLVALRLTDVLLADDGPYERYRTEIEKYLSVLTDLIEKYENERFPEVGSKTGRDTGAWGITPDLKVELMGVGSLMHKAGLPSSFIASAVETGFEFEGVYDLMKMWAEEEEEKERGEIIADIQDLINDCAPVAI